MLRKPEQGFWDLNVPWESNSHSTGARLRTLCESKFRHCMLRSARYLTPSCRRAVGFSGVALNYEVSNKLAAKDVCGSVRFHASISIVTLHASLPTQSCRIEHIDLQTDAVSHGSKRRKVSSPAAAGIVKQREQAADVHQLTQLRR